MQVWIVARNRLRAQDAARARGLSSNEWTFLSRADSLRGLSDPELHWVPGWQLRPDAREVVRTALLCSRRPDAEYPGWGGSVGPFPLQYPQPHVYARDIHSGAGNCVCNADLTDARHIQAAPGVPLPD